MENRQTINVIVIDGVYYDAATGKQIQKPDKLKHNRRHFEKGVIPSTEKFAEQGRCKLVKRNVPCPVKGGNNGTAYFIDTDGNWVTWENGNLYTKE